MTWFKVDDGLAFHAKVVAAGNAAMGLWVRAGSWSANHLTEGFIPDHMAATLGSKKEAQALVTAHLWTREDGGYLFWQWDEEGRQPTRAQVEKERAATRKRQERARERARESRVSHGVTHGEVTPEVTVPPTRPDPTRSSSGSVNLQSSPPSPAPTTKIEQLRVALQTLYRKPYPADAAKRTAELVLAGRTDVTDPVQYVLAAVKADRRRFAPPEPALREVPTPRQEPTDEELERRAAAAAEARRALAEARSSA